MIRKLFTLLILCALPLLANAATSPSGIHPVVAVQSGWLFGGTVNSKWVDSYVMVPRLTGKERYRLYSITAYLGEAIGSKLEIPEDGGSMPKVDLTLTKTQSEKKPLLAIAGAWNALPRVPKVQHPNQVVYRQAVQALLAAKGVPHAAVQITKLWRIDLDGDGQEEVLIEAITPRKGFGEIHEGTLPYKKGDYSLLLMRKLLHGKVVTIPIAMSIYTHDAESETDYPMIHTLVAALDVNGDGSMEIIGHNEAVIERGMNIYQLQRDHIKDVLGAGDGP